MSRATPCTDFSNSEPDTKTFHGRTWCEHGTAGGEGGLGKACVAILPRRTLCPTEKIIADASFQSPFPWNSPAPINLTLLFTAAPDTEVLSPKPVAVDLLGDLHRLGFWEGRPAQMLQLSCWGTQDILTFFSWHIMPHPEASLAVGRQVYCPLLFVR